MASTTPGTTGSEPGPRAASRGGPSKVLRSGPRWSGTMAREATCSECGQTLGIPQIARLEEEDTALCEDCTPPEPGVDEDEEG